MKLTSLFFLSIFICSIAASQDINFDDLKRPGRPLSISATTSGLADEARNHMSQFDEVDTGRRESLAASRSVQSAQPQSNSSSTSGKQFKCEYSCFESGNFMYSGGSTKSSTTFILAKDKYDAERKIENTLRDNNTCKGLKSSGGLSLLPKAVCRE